VPNLKLFNAWAGLQTSSWWLSFHIKTSRGLMRFLRLKDAFGSLSRLKMCKIRENDFLIERISFWFDCATFVETCCYNMDMCKFESPQSDQSRVWQAGSSKAYSQPRTSMSIRTTHSFLIVLSFLCVRRMQRMCFSSIRSRQTRISTRLFLAKYIDVLRNVGGFAKLRKVRWSSWRTCVALFRARRLKLRQSSVTVSGFGSFCR